MRYLVAMPLRTSSALSLLTLSLPALSLPAILFGVSAAGCGGEDAPPGPVDPEPAACDVTLVDPAITVADGGLARLELAVGEDVTELSAVVDQGEIVATDDAWQLRAPYGAGAVTVTLPHLCAGEAAEAVLSIPVRVSSWSALPSWTAGVDGPINREYGNFWIDPADPDRAWAFGGFHYEPQQFTAANELWSLDLTTDTWSQHSPVDPPLQPGAGLALVGEGEAIVFGGLIDSSTTPFLLSRLDYAAEPPTFTDLATGSSPSFGDYQPSLLWDAPRGRVLSICGVNTSAGYHCDVRLVDPATGEVTVIETAGEAPVGRNGHFWVHDAVNERFVMFSGDRGAPTCDCHPDTWALELAEDPPRWVALDTPGAPVGRRNGAYALDPDGQRMFVWGGTPDGATTAPGLWALHLEQGREAWHQVMPSGEAPPERASGAMIYDAARKRLIMGFGNSGAGNFTDMWSLSL